ncbi:hypothetical protein H5410_013709 [Solanum commersonii]|uniref:Ulp1 protease family, C-terminal catalytic domain containing protein n=1 Tax=Solanum commersonii TaxID=4109 RepID=A0A9J5ZNX1_SOLCO|nr:hypothetical protein H5410_013709 [Solanum commersonii]
MILLYQISLPKGTIPNSTPSKQGHSHTIYRILKFVPSPGGQSLSVGVSQINSINDNRIYDSANEMWAENRSKRLHDPLVMKDKSVVKPKIKVGETPKKGRRKVASVISRPTLPKGQNTKCMLLLEVQHENKDLLYVRHANETVLQFSIKDFAIVTGLKCKGNVKDFSYPESTMSRLLQRYFPDIKEFLMVEDSRYELYPWGQIAFDKLITSLRQDFNLSKQIYRLFGMSYALNSKSSVAVKVASGIPKICNWRVVAVKPKFGTFMSSIFSENAYSNIVPTPDEVEALDLHDIQDAHTLGPSTTAVDAKKVQTKDSSVFEDFFTSLHGHLFRRSSRVSGTSFPPPPKRRKKIDTSKTKVSKPKSSELLRPPINQSFPMLDKAPTPAANVSYVHVSSQGQKDKSVYPDIEELKQHMKDYVDNKFEYLVALIKANHTELMNSRHREDDQQPKDNASGQMPQHFFEGTMNEDASNKDSMTSGTISSETREAMDTLIVDLGRLPIPTKPVSAVNPQEMPSQILKSPYLASFGSSEKGKEVMEDVTRPYFPFEGCEITNRTPDFLIYEYIQWVTRGLLKSHANKARSSSLGFEMMDYVVAFPINKNWFYAMSQPKNCWTDQADDNISIQEHIDRASAVLVHEWSITNIMKGFSIPAGLPWHLVDDVYIPVNCTRRIVHYEEIKKLSRMLPFYVLDSGFFEKTERTNWPDLDAYKDKQTGALLEPHHPFNVEYAEGIMQKEYNSLDFGLYVATFAEFLSDQLVIPHDSDAYLSSYLRNRYASLLWRYGSDKAKGGYISENDDPPKPKGQFTKPTEEDFVNIV